MFPLSRGSKGQEVATLQRYLNGVLSRKGQKLLKVDGIFGSKTAAAVTSTWGHLDTPSVSKRLFDHVLSEMQKGNTVPNQTASSDKSRIEDMEGAELITFICRTDADTYKLILANLETINRANHLSPADRARLQSRITGIAQSYQTRQKKIEDSPAIKVNRASIKAFEWLRKKWDNLISGPQLLVPIAIGATAFVTGLLIAREYFRDGWEALQDRKDAKAVENELRELLAPEDFKRVMELIRKADRSAYSAGKANAAFSLKPEIMVGAGLLLVGGYMFVQKRKQKAG